MGNIQTYSILLVLLEWGKCIKQQNTLKTIKIWQKVHYPKHLITNKTINSGTTMIVEIKFWLNFEFWIDKI